MTAGSILFVVCSLLCLAGALITVLAKNPIRGAMGLLGTIFGIAGLFLRLHAQFLAAIQLIVYAGAIVVLFVFVVMLLGPSAHLKDQGEGRAFIARIVSGALMSLLGLCCLALFAHAKQENFAAVDSSHGSVDAIGRAIFVQALVPFELATVLLIVAVVGAIAVARSKPHVTQKPRIEDPTLRMYHGPLTARDAERPLGPRPRTQRVVDEEAV